MTIFQVADEHAVRSGSAVGASVAALMLATRMLRDEALPPVWYIVVCLLVGYVAYRLARSIAYFIYMTWIGAMPLPPVYDLLFNASADDSQEQAAAPVEAKPPSRSGGPVRDPNWKGQPKPDLIDQVVRHELVSPVPCVPHYHSAVFEDYPEILPKLLLFLRENPARVFSGRALEIAGVVRRDPRMLPNARIVLEYLGAEGMLTDEGNNMYSLDQRGREWLEHLTQEVLT